MKNESKNVSIVRMTGVKPARPQMLKKKDEGMNYTGTISSIMRNMPFLSHEVKERRNVMVVA